MYYGMYFDFHCQQHTYLTPTLSPCTPNRKVHGSFTLVSALTFAAIVLIFLCVVGTLMMAGVLPTWAGKG